jgi:DNA-binding transcriptional MerR regulator
MTPRTWKIGAVADATGLSVRALHHYDELGLLRPSGRTGAGHRVYDENDLRRLQQIVALRDLGMRLDDIRAALERDRDDPRPALHAQLERIDEQLASAAALRRRLVRILDDLDAGSAPSIDEVIAAIQETTRMEQYYTPQQLAQLEERRRALGPEGIARAQQDWADVIRDMELERQAGTDPSDPRVQAIAARWRELIAQFTGGDEGIRDALGRMYEREGAEKPSRGMVSEALAEYVRAAMGYGLQPGG